MSSIFKCTKQCCDIEKGDYMMINEHACKIINILKSNTGKHGLQKYLFRGVDIFDESMHETIFRSHDLVEVPIVTIGDYLVSNIIDDEVFLSDLSKMDKKLEFNHVKLPNNDLSHNIKSDFDIEKTLTITVISALGRNEIMTYLTPKRLNDLIKASHIENISKLSEKQRQNILSESSKNPCWQWF